MAHHVQKFILSYVCMVLTMTMPYIVIMKYNAPNDVNKVLLYDISSQWFQVQV